MDKWNKKKYIFYLNTLYLFKMDNTIKLTIKVMTVEKKIDFYYF